MKNQHDAGDGVYPQKYDKDMQIAFKKLKSLINTIEQMVIEDRYCPEIMQQILAAIGLLRGIHKRLLKQHLRTCFVEAVSKGNGKDVEDLIEEIARSVDMYNKK